MRNVNAIEINGRGLSDILAAHALWLEGDGGERANLSGANLSRADLSGANLSGANLSRANLSRAQWRGLTLSRLTAAHGLYDYSVYVALDLENTPHIALGCKLETAEKWREPETFWNNLLEFPDDGSEKTLRRRAALDWALAMSDILKSEVRK